MLAPPNRCRTIALRTSISNQTKHTLQMAPPRRGKYIVGLRRTTLRKELRQETEQRSRAESARQEETFAQRKNVQAETALTVATSYNTHTHPRRALTAVKREISAASSSSSSTSSNSSDSSDDDDDSEDEQHNDEHRRRERALLVEYTNSSVSTRSDRHIRARLVSGGR